MDKLIIATFDEFYIYFFCSLENDFTVSFFFFLIKICDKNKFKDLAEIVEYILCDN